ncbi:MAG TPA: class I SAM-dependent methyltransferase [Candidatus Peribacterales bacterium]|nr:class I SAM-dependent methyltransferase [Candidatus Peribacterales bacterium]
MKQKSSSIVIAHSPFRSERKGADRTIRNASTFDREYFEEENYVYSRWYLDQAKKVIPRILKEAKPANDWVFLDIGCALGGMVKILRERGFAAYGVDLSQYCIRTSPMKQYLRFGSVTDLPCADESVDVALCFDTFQYLTKAEAKKAAKELRRITRRLLFFECITKEDADFSDPTQNPDTARKNRSLFSREEYIALFTSAGFRLKKLRFLPRSIPGKPYPHEFSFNAIFEVV